MAQHLMGDTTDELGLENLTSKNLTNQICLAYVNYNIGRKFLMIWVLTHW